MLFLPLLVLPALPPPPPPAIHACQPRLEARGDDRPVSLGSHTSDLYPLRVHWTLDGHQDRAATVLEAAELAWQVQVDELGFAAPVLPDAQDGPELDIYLADLAPWEGWAWAPLQEDFTPGDGHMGAPAWIAFDRELPQEWLASYTVHEFNHVLQYATDFNEPSINFWEATAVAAQYWTLGDEGWWDADVADFQAHPWAPVLLGDGYVLQDDFGIDDSWFEYGAGLWVMALDAWLDDAGGATGPALWEAAANEGWSNEPDMVDAVVEVAGSLGGALDEIAYRRWTWQGLPGSESWGPDERVPAVDLVAADLPLTVDPDPAPRITGQAFVVVAGVGIDDLVVQVSSAAGLRSSLTLFEDGDAVVVALSNLGTDGWDGDDDPWVAGDQRILLSLRGQQPDPDGGDDDGDGCSCQAVDRSPGAGLSLLALAYLAIAAARRRASRCSSGEVPAAGGPSARP